MLKPHRTHTVVKTRMQLNGTSSIRSVARHEGVRALWRGTSVQVLNSLPTVGVYLMTYDFTLKKLSEDRVLPASLMPLFSGISARTVAVCLSSPIENVKTIMYSGSSKAPATIVREEISRGGIARLFRGFWPYFWRDGMMCDSFLSHSSVFFFFALKINRTQCPFLQYIG